ncbi:tripartite tricarboxylate transporter TctB family protein [Aquibaculum arenosum]|uniref:Tripartite tricarboxylate transporter TctB family protein n=1 Tax=Aquibaculum arenosum TaxID=3032591 RepID=A0ABT5YPX0_9PROT|nr:tripartite tricarboxylate transporter TctB family protein [Fodinicurvata sp. CAU 1616]MDF2096873.1 tripartite tricarboxylate transporter TctB family protein [Fodinicurvata sp. CAU 1616]
MSEERAEIAAGLILAVIGGACVAAAMAAPQPGLDPLGPGALPMAAALIVILLSLAMIGQALRRKRFEPSGSFAETADGSAARQPPSPLPLLLVSLVTLLYVAALAFLRLPYWGATLVFVTITVWLLSNRRIAALPKALAAGVILGFGCDYLFTQIFIVDLP